jgi:hypothetical protein
MSSELMSKWTTSVVVVLLLILVAWSDAAVLFAASAFLLALLIILSGRMNRAARISTLAGGAVAIVIAFLALMFVQS